MKYIPLIPEKLIPDVEKELSEKFGCVAVVDPKSFKVSFKETKAKKKYFHECFILELKEKDVKAKLQTVKEGK